MQFKNGVEDICFTIKLKNIISINKRCSLGKGELIKNNINIKLNHKKIKKSKKLVRFIIPLGKKNNNLDLVNMLELSSLIGDAIDLLT
ncbi:hypothetical protein BpHYR1_005097 [Brachionus plicatilis]|uniref:Uncharacterized protein n=1 Tax=Brachionus plicatilis TaxID=10195 RepID=A0A3M7QYZ9_BRAPC|nr:hypothetical protein BpHYR1_005097 [Brachionus plicatilis]